MLEITDLCVSVDGKEILNNLNLSIGTGEIHAVMGPNGSGKSTLSYILSGREGYEITNGSITYQGQDLLSLSPEIRSREGLFLAFQYPVEIPGVGTATFLKTIVNAARKHRGEKEYDAMEFLKIMKEKREFIGITEEMMRRPLNVGFSGGEKKRNEVLQMILLEPTLAVLDETDSGLDIDALKIAAAGVNSLRSSERSMIIITHYQRLLEYIVPDYVHVLAEGRVVKSGDKRLALELEQSGYGEILSEPQQAV